MGFAPESFLKLIITDDLRFRDSNSDMRGKVSPVANNINYKCTYNIHKDN